jgi:sporulation protein YlmC with PRC-barrel domain
MVGALTDRQELLSLKRSGVAVTPSEHVIGYAVHDMDNHRIGEVDDLIVDRDAGRVRFLVLGHGGLAGFGRTRHIIPVDTVTEIVGAGIAPTIFLGFPGALLEDAPRGKDLDEASLTHTCSFFGCEPYWTEGYRGRDWSATTA